MWKLVSHILYLLLIADWSRVTLRIWRSYWLQKIWHDNSQQFHCDGDSTFNSQVFILSLHKWNTFHSIRSILQQSCILYKRWKWEQSNKSIMSLNTWEHLPGSWLVKFKFAWFLLDEIFPPSLRQTVKHHKVTDVSNQKPETWLSVNFNIFCINVNGENGIFGKDW